MFVFSIAQAGGGLQQQQQQQQDDQTDGAAAAAAQQQQNTGVRRLSLVRRPTVTVLINQQAGTPTTPGTPKVYEDKRSDSI